MSQMKKDPICGMDVEITVPHKIENEGNITYFCSEGCLDKFEKAALKAKDEYASCDDADPQSNCEKAPQGSSVDLQYQKMVK